MRPVATHPWASAPTPGWHTASEHSFGATHTLLSGWCTQAPPLQKSSVHPKPSSQVIDWPEQVPAVHRSPTVHGSPSSHAFPSPTLLCLQTPRSQMSSVQGSLSRQSSFCWQARTPNRRPPPQVPP
jgi:hypothetical protein